MCGRFVSAAPAGELARYFGTDLPEQSLRESYNVAPTNEVYVVRAPKAERQLSTVRELTTMRWGLVPFWAKDPKVGSRMINARSETAAQKPAFRRAFSSQRCLIPADGFYEWAKKPAAAGKPKKSGKVKKQPFFVHRSDGEPVVFAGLWESWGDRNSSEGDGPQEGPGSTGFKSCTILTCAPNDLMATIHDRMPVLMAPRSWDAWLDPGSDREPLEALMKPAPEGLLELVAVSTQVNSVSNNGPDLLMAAKESAQGTIFGPNHE